MLLEIIMKDILAKEVVFDKNTGLSPVVVQDYQTGEVLMLAYANLEALELTVETGYAHFFSRSREKIWKKGESSGQLQKIHDILYDCDADALLYKVDQIGEAACHTGRRSCFFNRISKSGLEREITQPLIDPKRLYK